MRLFSFLFIWAWALPLFGQAYFQQDVAYDIKVTLNDETDELNGQLTLEYTNNSPDVLAAIPFHIWPNAYSSDASAFAKQMLRNGNTKFHFADASKRGELDGLNFTVDGQPAPHRPDEEHLDIVHLPLPSPLAPGARATIRTPFRVNIPNSFSRLGHVGDSYQMTQWYPKPAVYDRDGWHAMPYLDQGEFYSEFGSFRVSITLPENYVVGATGTLVEASERTWLLARANDGLERMLQSNYGITRSEEESEPFPPSSDRTKTITYVADRVHDFAWFADKRFNVLHDTLHLPGVEEPIDVWSMFTETEIDLWSRSIEYLKRSTRFYSEKVGTYPYPQVTGVQSALSAGAGMEYPMITVIGLSYSGRSLDEVLAHEVGHNWFYGILGSNERDSPWMDEGFNSYYEARYMDTFYEPNDVELPLVGSLDLNRTGYQYLARQGRDQAPDTDSDSLSQFNYWIQAYSKPAMALQELEAFIGRERLDEAMRTYFDRWSFRHPQPEDVFSVFEEVLGPEVSPWFTQAMTTTLTSDWKVSRLADGQSALSHSGPRSAPAAAQKETLTGEKIGLPPVLPKNDAVLEAGEDAVAVVLPADDNPLDLKIGNNRSGARKLALGLGIGAESAERARVYLLPIIGYNIHDGVQAGLVAHNRGFEPKTFEWMVAPLYGFGSSQLNGFGGGRYRITRPFNGVRQVLLSAGTQRFSDFTLARTEEAYSYQRTALKAAFEFDNPPITQRESSVFAQAIYLAKDRAEFDGSPEPAGMRTETNLFLRLGYQAEIKREITPLAYALTLEYKDRDDQQPEAFETDHLRLDLTVEGGYQYEANHFFRWRVFGGYFLANDLREQANYPESALSLVDNADSDYRRDGLYFGRNVGPNQNSWPDQQLGRRQGGFRAPISSSFTAFQSNDFMLAANLDVDLPLGELPVPLGVFLDAGYYGFRATTSDPTSGTLSWVGGAALTALDGRVGLYLPLVADPDTKFLLEQRGNLLDRVSFRLNLEGWLPWKWVDGIIR
ncbi:M1 family metallopeptidase [Lewinella sp. 4G2]|uniref:M1 family metallopeptidase n=1 Tax=Lewinella sp. 4G2 TaxID=1803372 RepID=UPI0007B4EA58|nr:M1 family metallopeptidase [Lewinella sp. 4G2]OAV42926.1 hypothetical protein A3850_017030 [Lewinella sp. 4G2]